MAEKKGLSPVGIQNIAAGSAVLITITSGVYFYQKINDLEDRVKQLEQHLSSIIPRVDPKIGYNLHQCVQGIQILDRRITELKQNNQMENAPVKPVSIKPYKRLTNPSGEPVVNIPTASEIDEDDPEIIAAVAALKEN